MGGFSVSYDAVFSITVVEVLKKSFGGSPVFNLSTVKVLAFDRLLMRPSSAPFPAFKLDRVIFHGLTFLGLLTGNIHGENVDFFNFPATYDLRDRK